LKKKIPDIHKKMHGVKSFLHEIWRRKVVRTAGAYLVVAWVFVEASSLILEAFNVADVYMQVIIAVVAIGLPVTIVLSWVFDITSGGIVRTGEAWADEEEDEGPQTLSFRRQMIMLSAAIKIEALGDSVDPEDLLELQPVAIQLARKVCERFGGHLLPGRAGEVMAYFGYPVAAEDDARRAVRAALGLVEGIARLDQSKRDELNIGILPGAAVHSGEVITEESSGVEGAEPIISGVLPGAAAALMDQCTTGQVLITGAVQRIVKGYFDVEALGERSLGEGGSTSEVYQVLHESGARNRLEALGEEELQPLVGRDHELGMLRQNWQRAQEGQGQVVMVSGGPGIGKSRIVHAVREFAAEDFNSWQINLHCQSMQENTALYPITEYLRREVLHLDDFPDNEGKLTQIEGLLAEYNQVLEETAPLMAALLQVDLGDRYQPTGYSPQRQRKATLELLVDFLVERASQQPVLFIVEDLHWCDPTSLELFSLLLDEVPAHSLLAILTVRSPFEAPWKNVAHISQLNLAGLNVEAARAFCNSVGGNLPAAVINQITAKADGVPLFIEEVTKSIIESGTFERSLDEAQMNDLIETIIPATLQDALTSRLDRLGKVRKLALLGATVGRDFSHELISKLAKRQHFRHLDESLEQLVDAEILFRRGKGEKSTYRFKHALIQDAAYRQLIRKERHAYHNEIANLLSTDFPDLKEKQPELLALHYTRANKGEAAIPFWLNAGRKAARSSADHEAMSHFQHGIELLKEVNNRNEKTQLELELQTAMGPSLMATHGYSALAVEAAYARSQELCEQVGETPRLIPVLAGLWAYNQVRANLDKALEYAEKLHNLGRTGKNSDLLLESHVFLGVTSMHLAKFEGSVSHMRKAIELYDPGEHASHAYTYGQDPGMAAHAYLADALWLQGHPTEAMREAQLAITHARKLKHPHSLAFALAVAARMCVRHGDTEQARRWAEEALQVSDRYGFPVWDTMARILLVWVNASLSGSESSTQQMLQILKGYKERGTNVSTAYYMSLLAELYARQQHFDEALSVIEEALDPSYGEDRHAEPEAIRVRGQLLAKRGRSGDAVLAEKSLREALSLANLQNAGGWVLKASLSLAQFLNDHDQGAEAKTILELGLSEFSAQDVGIDIDAARNLLRLLGA
jgi:tetratricopeptide (TPR) repeat protein